MWLLHASPSGAGLRSESLARRLPSGGLVSGLLDTNHVFDEETWLIVEGRRDL
jgi:hypothetical protein